LADHLRLRRPGHEQRHVFLRVHAPRAPLTTREVCSVMRNACTRAGLDPTGARRLRHTAATEIRRTGGPMGEISQLLRHRRTATLIECIKVHDRDNIQPTLRLCDRTGMTTLCDRVDSTATLVLPPQQPPRAEFANCYEPDAVMALPDGTVATGHTQIRSAYAHLVSNQPHSNPAIRSRRSYTAISR